MTKQTGEEAPTDSRQDRDAAAPQAAAPEKKMYRKPELSKYEQLNGIGLGS